MKIIGYCRVSSEEQAREGLSLALQEEKIRAYCSLNDYTVVDIVVDAGVSAKNIKGRKGFQQVLARVLDSDSGIDGIIVWKLDRAFRSTANALDVAGDMDKAGKNIISICEKIDTSTAQGRFFYTMLNALAQLERDQTSERTKVILESKKAKGEFVGKPRFGYKSGGKKLVEDDSQQVVMNRIRNLVQSGQSYRAMATTLNAENILTKQGKCWTHKQISSIVATL